MGTGAVAVIGLSAPDGPELDQLLERLRIHHLEVGRIALHDLLGVDRCVVMRWSETAAALMPHGGGAVVRAVCEALEACGLKRLDDDRPADLYQEAAGEIEAAMLAVLARARSPLAVDLLLDQPRRWSELRLKSDPDRDRLLNRLIDPPLVVARGASNIGKSTLVNALAGRRVSLVADEPGTTRDHVGVFLDLAGLVVRYVDTPGMREQAPEIEAEAVRITRDVLAQADLVLSCSDPGAAPVDGSDLPASADILRVGLRSDLGSQTHPVEVEVSARDSDSLARLVELVREKLVPRWVLDHPGPWRFWKAGEVQGVHP
ncbi:MAG: 50S ribosome-binding GTPase [Phycisphaeraceae bacterium]|nr:50S ribosome-binding GTPase [Phycisphaeraceae bacterium]